MHSLFSSSKTTTEELGARNTFARSLALVAATDPLPSSFSVLREGGTDGVGVKRRGDLNASNRSVGGAASPSSVGMVKRWSRIVFKRDRLNSVSADNDIW